MDAEQQPVPGFTAAPAPDDDRVPVGVVPGHDLVVTRDSDGRRIGCIIAPGNDGPSEYEAHASRGKGSVYLDKHPALDGAVRILADRMANMRPLACCILRWSW